MSKRNKTIASQFDLTKSYRFDEAVDVLQQCPSVKFDQTVEIAIKMGLDPKKSDQQMRGTVSLPHGTGKSLIILVFTTGEKVQEALNAGADYVGSDELFAKIKKGWTDFDMVIASPDLMREVGKLGKILGPRGLMPSPKTGTVTNEVTKAIQEFKKGKIEFKLDRHGVCNNGVGKLSFTKEAIIENIRTLLSAIQRIKPASAKGQYFQSLSISSTMGPGLKIDYREMPST